MTPVYRNGPRLTSFDFRFTYNERAKSGPATRERPGPWPTPMRGASEMSKSYRAGGAQAEQRYKKRAIPQATRRAVALAAGGVPGETVPASCAYCGTAGRIYWPRLYSGRPGAWVHFPGLELDHVTPERAGGPATPENMVLACARCNRSRGHRHAFPPRTGVA